MYKGCPKIWNKIPDVLTALKLIKNTDISNFLSMHIPVQTNLNVTSCTKYLVDYFDQQLPDLIEFGFPLN